MNPYESPQQDEPVVRAELAPPKRAPLTNAQFLFVLACVILGTPGVIAFLFYIVVIVLVVAGIIDPPSHQR